MQLAVITEEPKIVVPKIHQDSLDFGVEIGKAFYFHELNQDSKAASEFQLHHAYDVLRNCMKVAGVILAHQESIAYGIKFGVKIAGKK